jgi:hypothetical protein
MKFLNKETTKSTNESFQQIYALAEEISRALFSPSFINVVLDSRRKAQNIIKRLRLNYQEIVSASPSNLAEFTELIATKPEAELDSVVDHLECVSTLKAILLGAKDFLKDSLLFAAFDNVLASLEMAEKELTEQLADDTQPVYTGSSTTTVNNIVNVVNPTSANISFVTNYKNKLNGYELGVLKKEILNRYATRDDFNINVCSLLDIDFDRIGGRSSSYETCVYDLLKDYILPRGLLPNLLEILVSQRPFSTVFQSFVIS